MALDALVLALSLTVVSLFLSLVCDELKTSKRDRPLTPSCGPLPYVCRRIGIVDRLWKAGLVIAKLGQCASKVDQVLEGPQGIRTGVAAQDNLPFQGRGDDQAQCLGATLLEQTRMSASAPPSTSSRIWAGSAELRISKNEISRSQKIASIETVRSGSSLLLEAALQPILVLDQ